MILPGGFTVCLHLLITALFLVKMLLWRVLLGAFLSYSACMLLPTRSDAGILDLHDWSAPGSIWAKVDRRLSEHSTRLQYSIMQAAQYKPWPHIEPYVGVTKYIEYSKDRTPATVDVNSAVFGLRNTTLLTPFIFGVEWTHYFLTAIPMQNQGVVYISVYKGWDLFAN